MLLIQTSTMHQEINKSRHQKGSSCVLRPVNSTMHMLFKQN